MVEAKLRMRTKVVNDRIEWLLNSSSKIQSQNGLDVLVGTLYIHYRCLGGIMMICAIAKPFISHSFVCIQNMAIDKDYITFIYHVWNVHSSNHVTRLFKWICTERKEEWKIFLIMAAWNDRELDLVTFISSVKNRIM